MRELFTKVASLTLGVGALGFVMVNAALTHGCASSPATQVTLQAAPTPKSNTTAVADDPTTDPDCQVPEYMYATKAPVWTMLPPKCRGEAPANAPVPPQSQAPSPPVEAQQQAP